MNEVNFFKVPDILIVVNGGLQHDKANKTLSILFRLHFIIKQFFKEKFFLSIRLILAFSNSIDPNSSENRFFISLL